MTKKLLLAMAILAAACATPPALADEDGFSVHGQLRDRYENFNNYTDFADTEDDDLDPNTPDNNDRHAFWATRALIGIDGHLTDGVWVAIDIQNVGTFGDRDPVGSGATFGTGMDQNFENGVSESDTSLYRAVIGLNEIGGSNLSVTIGRNNKTVGGGLILGDEPFYNGNVFDGIDGTYKFENWSLGGFRFVADENNDPANAGVPGHEDTYLTGVTAGFGLPWESNLEVYVVNVYDGEAANFKPEFNTIGGMWSRDAKEGGWDWMLQLAVQSGDATNAAGTEFDIAGSVVDLNGGYTWANGVSHSIFGGLIAQSGDDDTTDDSFDAWHAIAPTTHGRFGNADFFGAEFGVMDSGITAFHVGYAIADDDDRHKGWVKLWNFSPTEDSIETGASNPVEIEDFGTEIDLGYSYKYGDVVKLFAAVAQLSPDDGLTGGGADDGVMRFYAGATVMFGGEKEMAK